MSNIKRVSYVVEGPTDFLVLDALVARFLGTDNYVPTQIQPPISAIADNQGPLGGGWKGVLRWCEDIGSNPDGFAGSAAFANSDCLIIHVDADIATKSELQSLALAAPCPPAKDACDKIRDRVLSLLGGAMPPKVILCIPAQCTEARVFAALHPDEASRFSPIECRPDAARLLIGKAHRLARDKDGAAKKQTARYRNEAPRIAANWPHIADACEEARRFEIEFTALQGAP